MVNLSRWTVLVGIFFVVSSAAYAQLQCNVIDTTTEACSGKILVRISSLASGHAEIASGSGYKYAVCCQSPDYTVEDSCSLGPALLHLSDTANAHVEKNTFSNYNINVCISSPDNVYFDCDYFPSDCGLVGYDTCVATLKKDSNSDISDCITNPLPTRVCCREAGPETCEDDCTFLGDNTVHKLCDGINGCGFYDSQAADVCDNAQPGWIRDYSGTQTVECAEGVPQLKTEVKSVVTCEKENLIKIPKVVSYKGKLVKMYVVMCG
jgi:hypothetical protein